MSHHQKKQSRDLANARRVREFADAVAAGVTSCAPQVVASAQALQRWFPVPQGRCITFCGRRVISKVRQVDPEVSLRIRRNGLNNRTAAVCATGAGAYCILNSAAEPARVSCNLDRWLLEAGLAGQIECLVCREKFGIEQSVQCTQCCRGVCVLCFGVYVISTSSTSFGAAPEYSCPFCRCGFSPAELLNRVPIRPCGDAFPSAMDAVASTMRRLGRASKASDHFVLAISNQAAFVTEAGFRRVRNGKGRKVLRLRILTGSYALFADIASTPGALLCVGDIAVPWLSPGGARRTPSPRGARSEPGQAKPALAREDLERGSGFIVLPNGWLVEIAHGFALILALCLPNEHQM